MGQTPSEKLKFELEARDIGPVEFATKVGRSYQTVYNWCEGKGFKKPQRSLAASALGEPPDYFEQPDIAAERENLRRAVLRQFGEEPLGKTLSPEEWRSINALRWPQGREPTVADLRGWIRIIRGQLTQAEFDRTIDGMREASSPQNGDDNTAKKPKKRRSPRSPHRRLRK